METSKILLIWGYIGIISLLLIAFRPDGNLILKDLLYLSFRSVFSFIATVALMYIILPGSLVDSIVVIYKNHKK
jgi:hypothetical protein